MYSDETSMSKKNDKRLCWNCNGNVGLYLDKCPYCAVDLNTTTHLQDQSAFNPPFAPLVVPNVETPPPSPYAHLDPYNASNKEWEEALEGKQKKEPQVKEKQKTEEKEKNEIFALFLLLPGIVFFLFGIALLLFSKGGVFTLQWNQNFAYFYFIGSIPLIFLGYKALR
jgi:hypothetical protein